MNFFRCDEMTRISRYGLLYNVILTIGTLLYATVQSVIESKSSTLSIYKGMPRLNI